METVKYLILASAFTEFLYSWLKIGNKTIMRVYIFEVCFRQLQDSAKFKTRFFGAVNFCRANFLFIFIVF